MRQIRFSGFGGQGIILMGEILGEAASMDGREVSQSAVYGAEARGSSCRSEVIVSEKWIDFPKVDAIDILVAMSQDGYEQSLPLVREDGKIYYDPLLVKPKKTHSAKHVPVEATRTAREVLKNPLVANIVMLAAVVELEDLVSEEALRESVKKNVPSAFTNINIEAAMEGKRLAVEAIVHEP